MVRHSEDYHMVRHALDGAPSKLWEGDSFSLMGRDPVLTDNGVRAAADGFTAKEATAVYPGYKGIKGGVRGKVQAFQPSLVVASPLRRSLLTTVIACEQLALDVPIVAHPDLREIKSEKVHLKTPNHVKPGAHGVPLSLLRETLSKTKRGPDVDLSLLRNENRRSDGGGGGGGGSTSGGVRGEGGANGSSAKGNESNESNQESWHPTNETPQESRERATRFLSWLRERKEKRVVIFTHGGVLKLPVFGATRFLHGECRRYTFDGEQMILDGTFEIDQHDIPTEQLSLLKAKDMQVVVVRHEGGSEDRVEKGGQ